MDIYDGHLCKSGPVDAANFGLQINSEKSEFHGNINVSVQFSDCLSTEKGVDIRIGKWVKLHSHIILIIRLSNVFGILLTSSSQ